MTVGLPPLGVRVTVAPGISAPSGSATAPLTELAPACVAADWPEASNAAFAGCCASAEDEISIKARKLEIAPDFN
jgi:hypothetical protein